MKENRKSSDISKGQKHTIYDSWERFGLTKHWGGVKATRQLIESCKISPKQYVLDVGCGTGYAACLIAEEYGANVAALDIRSKVLERTNKRIEKAKVRDRVKTYEADAQNLPFESNTFHAVIAESVLVFCDKKRVCSQVYRVLKPGGYFGDNEGTFLKPTSLDVQSFLSKSYGMNVELLREEEWKALLKGAGFEIISSNVYPFNPLKQFWGELRIDGMRRLSAWRKAFSDPAMRITIFQMDKETRDFMRQFMACVGYGLYVTGKC